MPTVLPPPDSQRRRAIVLVHGAWVGEWSWVPIEPALRASGRAVYPVSLTGHGARRHQSGPHVTLSDHVADVVSHIEVHDLTEVTLVGHSYGGRVITGAAGAVADRVAAMVYLDAHTPVADDPGQPPERVEAAEANGGMLPFTGYRLDPSLVGGPEGVAWFLARTMPQSFACFTEPWRAELPDRVRKTFVYATGDPANRFARYAEICRDAPDWAYHELAGHHFLMLSHPDEVAAIIIDA